jgi:hypothetical protein
MAKDIKDAIHRTRDTLIGDMIGAVSLLVMLYGGLMLPAIF